MLWKSAMYDSSRISESSAASRERARLGRQPGDRARLIESDQRAGVIAAALEALGPQEQTLIRRHERLRRVGGEQRVVQIRHVGVEVRGEPRIVARLEQRHELRVGREVSGALHDRRTDTRDSARRVFPENTALKLSAGSTMPDFASDATCA